MIISGIVIVVIGVILLEIFGSILLQKDTSPFVLFAFAGFFMIATGFIVIYGEGKEGILLGTGRECHLRDRELSAGEGKMGSGSTESGWRFIRPSAGPEPA